MVENQAIVNLIEIVAVFTGAIMLGRIITFCIQKQKVVKKEEDEKGCSHSFFLTD